MAQPVNPSAPKHARCSRCGSDFTFTTVAAHKTFPFCSQRCRDVDLGNWMIGTYAIPCEEPLIDDGEAMSPERDAT